MQDAKLEVEHVNIDFWYCPYCEERYEDDERAAEICRDRCYEGGKYEA